MAGEATVFTQGFALSAGLIMAIGAQNVFVLTQGVRGHRPWLVAGACTLCDCLLISLGVGGVGALFAAHSRSAGLLALAGAGFLALYGVFALQRCLRGGSLGIDETAGVPSAKAVLLTALGLSLLNPHALLDTMVLIGGLAARLDGAERPYFGLGAMAASACWFFSLSLGGRLLAPALRRPAAWRVLDGVVFLTMWGLAVGIGREALADLGL